MTPSGRKPQTTRTQDLNVFPLSGAQSSWLQLSRVFSHSRLPGKGNLVLQVLSWKLPGAAQPGRGPGRA